MVPLLSAVALMSMIYLIHAILRQCVKSAIIGAILFSAMLLVKNLYYLFSPEQYGWFNWIGDVAMAVVVWGTYYNLRHKHQGSK